MSELVATKADDREDRRIFEWDEASAAARVNSLLAS